MDSNEKSGKSKKRAGQDNGADPGGSQRVDVRAVTTPRRSYIVGRRGLGGAVAPLNAFMPMSSNPGSALSPLSLTGLVDSARKGQLSGVRVKKTVKRAQGLAELSPLSFMGGAPAPEDHEVVVLEMEDRHASQIAQHPDAVVEIDHDLRYQSPYGAAPGLAQILQGAQANQQLLNQMIIERRQALYRTMYAPSAQSQASEVMTVNVSATDRPACSGAEVMFFGSSGTVIAKAVSDDQGVARLDLQGTPLSSVVGAYVKPAYDYWERYIPQPQFDENDSISVILRPLSSRFPGFPQKRVIGWGMHEMGIPSLPGEYNGEGVKIAIIDSGAATTHDDLSDRVREGYDLVNQSDSSWQDDQISHGSHCAGVVTGLSPEGIGIKGIATAAEVMAMKIFPGGSYSDLIGALHRCIEQGVDAVNLSLGSDQESQLVEQAIVQAKDQGMACIVAAGNSGGPVQYPARSANTLAVSAIGKFGTFPQDSFHAMQVMTELGAVPTQDGLFAARFSCFGPEVDVCAPGVAILSSVPPNNYASWDGTSMATPHVTGLAALALAHHPALQGAGRSASRVEQLFGVLKGCSRPLTLGSPYHTGAGIPDARRMFGVSTQ